jgi:hypothetical protein
MRERVGAESLAYASELAGLGANLLHQGKYAAAEPVLRECLAVRQRHQPAAMETL